MSRFELAQLNRNYVYRSAHVEIMRRHREWLEHMAEAFVVLWWVPAGHRPTIQEAIAKLELLRRNGPTEDAFTFRNAYPPPDEAESRTPFDIGDRCPAQPSSHPTHRLSRAFSSMTT
jgi:hypothetical protein